MKVSYLLILLLCCAASAQDDGFIYPEIDGAWQRVATTPELPEAYQSEEQQPVDFGVWQAADGSWQLWSCIRHTKCGGHTRLFYGWEGKMLSATDWQPVGIKMEARPDLGEAHGGLQAPHVIRLEDHFLMAYGDWDDICFATSKDGKNFERIIQADGRTALFGEGPKSNTRDPMMISINDTWYCYYTAILNGRGYGLCRTSADLKTWSYPAVVSYGGEIGPGAWFNECPHVVEVQPGEFVYFRNQYYGGNQTNWAYYSKNPLNFGIDDDTCRTARLDIAAPEVVYHENRYYLFSLTPALDGIQMAPLKFFRCSGPGRPVFDFDKPEDREGWRMTEGDFPFVFTDTPHAPFNSISKHVIGTCETENGAFDDTLTGTIVSPPFTLSEKGYLVLTGGGCDRENLYVAIINHTTGEVIARYTGENSNLLQRHRFRPEAYAGMEVHIEIRDRATGPWGHINFGGIYIEKEPVPVR